MRSPPRPPDPILDDHNALSRSTERHNLLSGGLSLGALTVLTACDIDDASSVQRALLAISRFNDRV